MRVLYRRGGGGGGHWDFPPGNYDVIIASTATIWRIIIVNVL